jgi:hypothetical protein
MKIILNNESHLDLNDIQPLTITYHHKRASIITQLFCKIIGHKFGFDDGYLMCDRCYKYFVKMEPLEPIFPEEVVQKLFREQ